ncbi:MAG: starch synthase, partial [Candidatus Nealsonbacteria bacterium CG23_combo_of_CG06-09_8_20_14_all_37_18]
GDVYIESDASSGGSEMEAKRFLFLSAAAIEVAKILKIDILHCHDWHTAIVATLPKNKNIKTLLTIHNLQYQGIYPSEIVNKLLGTNFSGEVNCLKEGILNADFINTVSPNYAKEILTSEYGYGLENFLKQRKNNLIGILNGIDTEEFNPKTDKNLKANYSLLDIEKKEENKIYLQKKYFKETNPNIPVLGMVSRLASQKGIDLIKEIFPLLMKENLQFILLGTGAREYEVFFEEKKKEFPQKFWTKIGFDDNLARQIYAGADIFLIPSLFEPCGLGQLIAMRYGTLPIARLVGGLKNTVTKETGFLFKNYNEQEFLQVIKKALRVYKNKKIWEKLQKNGMKNDFSWEKSAKEYLKIYKKLMVTS